MTPTRPRAIAVNSQRCQPSASARKLNAAPELNASTRLKKPVIASCSPDGRRRRSVALATGRRRSRDAHAQPGPASVRRTRIHAGVSPGVARVERSETRGIVATATTRVSLRSTPGYGPARYAGLREAARLAGPVEVGHAAAADRRMRGIDADVGAVVPAALALGVRARRRRAIAGRVAPRRPSPPT